MRAKRRPCARGVAVDDWIIPILAPPETNNRSGRKKSGRRACGPREYIRSSSRTAGLSENLNRFPTVALDSDNLLPCRLTQQGRGLCDCSHHAVETFTPPREHRRVNGTWHEQHDAAFPRRCKVIARIAEVSVRRRRFSYREIITLFWLAYLGGSFVTAILRLSRLPEPRPNDLW